MITIKTFATTALLLAGASLPLTAPATIISLSASDFSVTPTFSNARTFSFSIDVAAPLGPGTYSNPTLNGVVYSVNGSLAAGTPSGFPAFALQRNIGGAEFYAQGSSLSFSIAAGADLSDGLQIADLAGNGTVFVFNAREVDTGRYHPALLELRSDGSGTLSNSNNTGGINPSSNALVDVAIGDEYVSALGFDPAGLTLAAPVPLPAAAVLLASGVLAAGSYRRRRRAA